MVKRLIVYDFDWSMADQDSDRWIFECLAIDIRRKMDDLEKDVQWTDIVTQSLREGHARGITRQQIEDTLRAMPFHPAMERAIKTTKAKGDTTFFCLSNANSVFISTILESKGLSYAFEEIVTNPATWQESGLLDLRRRIDPDGEQHTCTVGCSPNMCKGAELDAFLKRHGEYDQVIYVGDGSNDFCPVLRLRSQDLVLCRTMRGLQRRITKEGGLKCQIKYWEGAWEIEELYATF
ncbi:phosphatase phospho-type [Mucidula mucida]|nr:phosphatase phospho-type [Mucidula mucida]